MNNIRRILNSPAFNSKKILTGSEHVIPQWFSFRITLTTTYLMVMANVEYPYNHIYCTNIKTTDV